MKLAHLIAMVILLSPVIFASELSVMVTATQDTLLPLTSVSVISDGVALSTAKTGQDGIARFNLTDGSYFVLLPATSIYPPFVALVDVKGNTGIKMTKHICSGACTSNAYGQITGPQSFSNSSVIAFSNGVIAKRTAPNSEGLFMLSYVPEGNYELVFESQGFEPLRLPVFLPASDFIEVNAQLQKIALPPEQKAEISASPQVSQYSIIEVVLSKGGPLSGKVIIATTPSGKVTLTTNSEGKAFINAAAPGTYSFSYAEGGAFASTSVVGKATVANETGAQTPPPISNPPENAQPQNTSPLLVVGLAMLVAAGAAVIVLAAIAAGSILRGGKKGLEGIKEGGSHGGQHKKR
jgi:hypothetical protein